MREWWREAFKEEFEAAEARGKAEAEAERQKVAQENASLKKQIALLQEELKKNKVAML